MKWLFFVMSFAACSSPSQRTSDTDANIESPDTSTNTADTFAMVPDTQTPDTFTVTPDTATSPDTFTMNTDAGPPLCYTNQNLGTLALSCDYTATADAWCGIACSPAQKYAYKCEQGAPFQFVCERMGSYWCCDKKQCVKENDFDRHCPTVNHTAYNCTGLPFKSGCVKSVNAAFPNLACCPQ